MDNVASRFPASRRIRTGAEIAFSPLMALLYIFKSTRILTFPDLSFDLVTVSSVNGRIQYSNLDNGFPRMLFCARRTRDTGAD